MRSILFPGLAAVLGQFAAKEQPYATWSDFGGTMDSMQYSSLRQINKTNVSKLELGWTHLVMSENSICLNLMMDARKPGCPGTVPYRR